MGSRSFSRVASIVRGEFLPEDESGGELRAALLVAALLHVLALLVVLPAQESGLVARGKQVVFPAIRRHVPDAVVVPVSPPRAPVQATRLILPEVEDRELFPQLDAGSLELSGLVGVPVGDAMAVPFWGERSEPPSAPGPRRVPTSSLRVLFSVEPEYPVLARRMELEGLVVLDVLVSADGKVLEVRVLQKRPGGLTEASVRAVEKWEFEPATQYGRQVSAWMRLEIRFELD